MLRPINQYFLEHDEKTNSCLQFLRQYILGLDDNISEAWKYQLPFYYYKNKRLCYLWTHKKHKQPYIGIVDGGLLNHPLLICENRTRMKIILVDPTKDIQVEEIDLILRDAISIHYKKDKPNK